MTDWLIILLAVGVLWALWFFMGAVADLFAYWYAARRGEESKEPTPVSDTTMFTGAGAMTYTEYDDGSVTVYRPKGEAMSANKERERS